MLLCDKIKQCFYRVDLSVITYWYVLGLPHANMGPPLECSLPPGRKRGLGNGDGISADEKLEIQNNELE
jgi:hypothetical protein